MSALRALLMAQWQQAWHRPGRLLLMVCLQVGVGAVALWRVWSAGSSALSLGGAAALIALQAGGWSFLTAFLAGRTQLYGGRTLALVQASAAPPLAVVGAAVLGGLGRRAWSMLLWAVGLGALAGLAAVPLLWALGLAVGTLGHLAGLLALIAWVRLAPRALGAAWVLVLVLQVLIVWFAVYQVAAGVELGWLQALVRGPLVGAAAGVFGLPGLGMLLWLGLAPARLGDAYRDGWLRLMELADGAARPRRSVWPGAAMVPGAAGAVLAKEWVLAGRNPATWFRLGALGCLGLFLLPAGARTALMAMAAAHHDLVVLGLGVGAVYFCFGEVIAAGFSAEGHRLGLLAVSGVGPARVLAGKVAAASPFALLCALGTWAVAAAAGDGGARQGAMAAAALLLGLGSAAIAAAGAACDARLTEAGEEHDLAALSALLEQVPRGMGGSLGFVVAAAWAGGCIWALAGALGLWPWLAPVPALALLAGWWRLRDQLRSGDIK